MKHLLVVEYSQTGQLTAVLDALLAPLQRADGEIRVHREVLRPIPAYPYPWPFWQFLDAFPETVAGEPPPLAPLTIDPGAAFDLIIIGYPVWFLSPPPPITAFLRSEAGRRLVCGRPVITVTACRNMWLMAQEQMKRLLADAGARHRDHVALVDQGNAFATFVTTPRWLLTGRKGAFWGFPPAGVPAAEIAASRRFGLALREALQRGAEKQPGPMLDGLRACVVDPRLIASEKIGRRSFRIWARVLLWAGRPGTLFRRAVLAFYLVFLLSLIITVVPLSMLLKAALRPLLHRRLGTLQASFEQPSGSATSRMASFHE
jgi:hypothetical protein